MIPVVIATGSLCAPCFAAALAEAEELRQVFDCLLEAGMSREAANARMIEQIQGRGGRA